MMPADKDEPELVPGRRGRVRLTITMSHTTAKKLLELADQAGKTLDQVLEDLLKRAQPS
jgi:hypothetical protein